MTPEGKVKRRVKEVLDRYGAYYFMPVQGGLGATGVDFHCCIACHDVSLAFFIETKAPGETLTPRQRLFLKTRREEQHAKTFKISGDNGINHLIEWLEGVRNDNEGRESEGVEHML